MPDHPDPNEILEFAEGVLTDEAAGWIEAHVDRCGDCRRLVAEAVRSSAIILPGRQNDQTTAGTTNVWDGPIPDIPFDPSRPLRRGDVLGRYVVLDQVGSGGMGAVYTAYDPELNRKVAIKVLRPERFAKSGSEGAPRLLREAQAIAQLTHRNVVTVHDVGTLGEQVFLAMEYVEGITLKTWMRAKKNRPWNEVRDMLMYAGRGLAAAHKVGLVHRDFKPDNVLIGYDGRVCVTDFGLARQAGGPVSVDSGSDTIVDDESTGAPIDTPLTRTGMILGTPAYMAPEQHIGEVDIRSDQFSFAVTLYEALYGQRPFAGRTMAELMATKDGPVRSVPKDARVPAWLHRVVLRALSSKPDERYGSMDDLLRELARDPGRTRRSGLLVAGIFALAAASVFFVVRESRLCTGADRKLAGEWDASRRSALVASFEKTKLPYAKGAAVKTAEALDRYAASWVVMHTEACEAGRRGENSAKVLDLRMSCLEARRRELGILVAVLSEGEPGVVDRSVTAAHKLSSLAPCADIEALQARVPLPSDPAVRQGLEAVIEKVKEAKALHDGGKFPEAEEAASAAVLIAEQTHYAPARAEALHVLGDALDKRGRYEDAAQRYLETVWAAEAGRDDRMAAMGWIKLLGEKGYRLARYEELASLQGHAQAALDRLGNDDELQADLFNNLGVIARNRDNLEEAESFHKQALALRQRVYGEKHLEVGYSLNNLGVVYRALGRYTDAQSHYARAIEIYETTYSGDHPQVARALNNLGVVLMMRGDQTKAVATHTRALKIRRAAYRDDHPYISSSLGNLSLALSYQGKHAEAIDHAKRALAIKEKNYGPTHPQVALGSSMLGAVELRAGQLEQAEKHHRRALTIREGALGRRSASAAVSLGHLAETERLLGRRSAARIHFEEAIAVIEEQLSERDPELAWMLTGYGALRNDVAVLERAMRLRRSYAGEPADTAQTAFALAKALDAAGSSRREEAVTFAAEARESWAASEDPSEAQLAEVDAWLAARVGSP